MNRLYVTREVIEEARKIWPKGTEKVAAIKFIRHETGAGLKEAKDFVESDYTLGILSRSGSDNPSDTVEWKVKNPSVPELMGRLFELSAEIAEVHNQLKKMEGFDDT